MDQNRKIMEEMSIKSQRGVIRDPREDAGFVPTLLEAQQPETDRLYDYFQVDEFAFDEEKGKVRLKATISLLKPSDKVKLVANIYNEEMTAVTSPIVSEGEKTAFLELIQTIDSIEEYRTGLTVHVVGEYESGGRVQHPFKAVRLCEDPRKYAKFEENYDYRPKKEKECIIFNDYNTGAGYETKEQKAGAGSEKYAVISLFRKPTNVDDCDYICKCRKGEGGQPFVCLPVKGKVVLREGSFAAEKQSASVVAIHLDKANGGAALCREEKDYRKNLEFTTSLHSKELEFENHDEFGMTFKEPGGSTGHHFRFELSIVLAVDVGGTDYIPVVITSDKNHATAIYSKIPDLNIMWGCLAQGTLIMMADGSSRPIEDVRIGERVKGDSSITNIWKGPAPDGCLEIVTQEGAKIILTGTHPLRTRYGWKRAEELAEGEELQMLAGTAVIASIKEVRYEGTVWNLELDAQETEGMYADGFLAGDFRLENRM